MIVFKPSKDGTCLAAPGEQPIRLTDHFILATRVAPLFSFHEVKNGPLAFYQAHRLTRPIVVENVKGSLYRPKDDLQHDRGSGKDEKWRKDFNWKQYRTSDERPLYPGSLLLVSFNMKAQKAEPLGGLVLKTPEWYAIEDHQLDDHPFLRVAYGFDRAGTLKINDGALSAMVPAQTQADWLRGPGRILGTDQLKAHQNDIMQMLHAGQIIMTAPVAPRPA